jgi:uncharacterized protein (DUF736 family)
MRKRISKTHDAAVHGEPPGRWLDVAQIATVEVTSEDPHFPIESVFTDSGPGWRAAQTGEQLLRLIFDEPVSVRRIQLRFHESEKERTQEFTLCWSAAQGGASREIVRQQWNFSPAGSTIELEDYMVSLEAVSALELAIRPNMGSNSAIATLAAWRVG